MRKEITSRKAPIEGTGTVTIPAVFCKKAGIKLGHFTWVIDDDEIAIVITKDFSGYESCERERCLLDAFGKLELPAKYLRRLEIDENQEIVISLSHDGSEIEIETFCTALF